MHSSRRILGTVVQKNSLFQAPWLWFSVLSLYSDSVNSVQYRLAFYFVLFRSSTVRCQHSWTFYLTKSLAANCQHQNIIVLCFMAATAIGHCCESANLKGMCALLHFPSLLFPYHLVCIVPKQEGLKTTSSSRQQMSAGGLDSRGYYGKPNSFFGVLCLASSRPSNVESISQLWISPGDWLEALEYVQT